MFFFVFFLFWGSEGLGWCESVELSSLFCFPGPEIGSLERAGAGCFFCVPRGFGVRKRRTVVTFGVLGSQNVELSSLLGF